MMCIHRCSKVLCAEECPLCLGGSSTCAGFQAIPDGNLVLSKAHENTPTRLHAKSKRANTIVLGPEYDGVEDKQRILDLSLSYLAKYNPVQDYRI